MINMIKTKILTKIPKTFSSGEHIHGKVNCLENIHIVPETINQ